MGSPDDSRYIIIIMNSPTMLVTLIHQGIRFKGIPMRDMTISIITKPSKPTRKKAIRGMAINSPPMYTPFNWNVGLSNKLPEVVVVVDAESVVTIVVEVRVVVDIKEVIVVVVVIVMFVLVVTLVEVCDVCKVVVVREVRVVVAVAGVTYHPIDSVGRRVISVVSSLE